MMRTGWTLLALGSILLASACGGSSKDDDGSNGAGGGSGATGSGGSGATGSGATPIADLPGVYAEAVCSAFESCAGPIYEVLFPGEDCVTRVAAQLEEEIPRIEEAIAKGTVVYDGSRLGACADEVRARTCAELDDRETETCREALDGTAELGESCTLSAECAGSAYCKFGASCPGVCAELELAGDLCDGDDQCASGLSCSDATERCVAPADEGELCDAGEPACRAGHLCAGADEAENLPGTCRPYGEILSGAEDDACSIMEGELCQEGLVCAVRSLSPLEQICSERVAAGEPCRIAVPDQCPDGEYCAVAPLTFEGTCTPRPEAGQPCATGQFEDEGSGTVCAPNTRCDGGTCRDFASLGESCRTAAVCYSSRCEGGACVSSASCE